MKNKYIGKKIDEIYQEIDRVNNRLRVYSDATNKRLFNIFTLINNLDHGMFKLLPDTKDNLPEFNRVKNEYKEIITDLTKHKYNTGLLFTLFLELSKIYLIIKDINSKEYVRQLLDIIKPTLQLDLINTIVNNENK